MREEHPQQYFETRVEVAGDPLAVATRLAETGPHGDYVLYENDRQWCYAGGVLAEVRVDRNGAELHGAVEARLPWQDQPLMQVRDLLATVPVHGWRAYGWASFELSYARNGGRRHLNDQRLLHLLVPRSEVRLSAGQAHVRSVDLATLTELVDLITNPVDLPVLRAEPVDVRCTGRDSFCACVRRAIDDITAHRLQKVILSRVVEVDYAIDLVATYLLGRRANTPARSFLLSMDGLDAAGFSPEVVASVTADGRVVSQPLAGTRAFSADAAENALRRADLLSSPKEIYEHAISVKVGNDELCTVCQAGSVQVRDLMTVQERGTVQHLASQVTGQLSSGYAAWDAFAAVFPAVTGSGVPKEAAYVAIRRYETEPRGLYSGAVLTVDQSGALDAALVLRSVYRQAGRTWLRAGAGIVSQSEPDREFEETCEKLDSVARFLVPCANQKTMGKEHISK